MHKYTANVNCPTLSKIIYFCSHGRILKFGNYTINIIKREVLCNYTNF